MTDPDLSQEVLGIANTLGEMASAKRRYQQALEEIVAEVTLTGRGITNLDPQAIPRVRHIAEGALGPRCVGCLKFEHQHRPWHNPEMWCDAYTAPVR